MNAREHDDPLDRLAAEEDWSRRARAVEKDVRRELRRPVFRPSRTPRPRGVRPERGGVSWIFVLLVLLTVGSAAATWAGLGPATLTVFVFVLSGWLVTLCLHEFAHALTAHRGGDDTVAGKGYLRLDPRRYGHPVLTLILPLLVLLIGGLPLPGGAVLIETHRLRNRLRDAMVSLAGPSVNIIAAAVLLTTVSAFGPEYLALVPEPEAAFWAALSLLAYLQVAAAILNLLPVPGLDGWGTIEPYLPASARMVGDRIKPFGILLVFALLWIDVFRDLFGEATFFFLDVSGIPLEAVGLGYHLFQFWRGW
ncbi:site-2 protease family protein [Catellatospora bangladeshensis]|uniref:Site-2 protease family protein n=1 Tax=Catellatospora bangladeshensis TaxID=310355 RepID=A0A8J3NH08_9ACTN|nr:site-2 protease family protein [Catellatospora bangladeshensis]GIF78761.1 site-2 protease family protein [Catellatospora bangladeshensis]